MNSHAAAAAAAPAFLTWLGNTAPAQTILESGWLFPTIETVHVLALALVFGSIASVDLRLLGLASRGRSAASVAAQSLPWTWGGFALAVFSGGLLFSSQPVKYWGNLPFRLKFVLLALAGLNMLLFQLRVWPRVAPLPADAALPTAARWAGGLSLLFWVSIVTAGRWIAFAGY
jgi:hypothetical protein